MKCMITGPERNLAYWSSHTPVARYRAFGMQGRFRRSEERCFARVSRLGANVNDAPSGRATAAGHDVIDLLFRIAEAR